MDQHTLLLASDTPQNHTAHVHFALRLPTLFTMRHSSEEAPAGTNWPPEKTLEPSHRKRRNRLEWRPVHFLICPTRLSIRRPSQFSLLDGRSLGLPGVGKRQNKNNIMQYNIIHFKVMTGHVQNNNGGRGDISMVMCRRDRPANTSNSSLRDANTIFIRPAQNWVKGKNQITSL